MVLLCLLKKKAKKTFSESIGLQNAVIIDILWHNEITTDNYLWLDYYTSF